MKFPIRYWLPRYSTAWIKHDLIAGLTTGLIVIPVAFANAQLAMLPLEYGLYTCFAALAVYPLFGTSKDVSVGSTSVLSTVVGQLISGLNQSINPITWIAGVTLIVGLLELLAGVLGLGIIVDFIPIPVIQGFMSGATIAVTIGQIPSILGLSVNSDEKPFWVFIETIKQLPFIQLDFAFGGTALVLLLGIKYSCKYLEQKYPIMKWISVCRNAGVVCIYTFASYLLNKSNPEEPLIKIVNAVNSGLRLNIPTFPDFKSVLAPSVTITIVGIIEHMAIVKSFARQNGYNIDPPQELIALGMGNILGSFFGGFPATGSFSRSAVSSQCGSKSPVTAFITALFVLFAIYFFMPFFFYIPKSVLSAVLITAIMDYVLSPKAMKQMIDFDLSEFISFALVVVCQLFFTIQTSIYVASLYSVLALLYKIARPKWNLLVFDEYRKSWVSANDQDLDLINGMLIVRVEEAIVYPNSTYLYEQLTARINSIFPKYKNDNNGWKDEVLYFKDINKCSKALNCLLFDMSLVNHIDLTGCQMILDILSDLEATGSDISLHFCNVSKSLVPRLSSFLRNHQRPTDVFYDGIEESISACEHDIVMTHRKLSIKSVLSAV